MKMWICPILVDHGRIISVTVERLLQKLQSGFLLEKNLGGQKTIEHCFKQYTIASVVLSIDF